MNQPPQVVYVDSINISKNQLDQQIWVPKSLQLSQRSNLQVFHVTMIHIKMTGSAQD